MNSNTKNTQNTQFNFDKINELDDKLKDILEKDFNVKLEEHYLKPKKIEEYIMFKKPNILYLIESEIKDDIDYVKPLKRFLQYLDEELNALNQEKLIIIFFMEFPIHNLITYLALVNKRLNLELYFEKEIIEKYNLKKLEEDLDLFHEDDIPDEVFDMPQFQDLEKDKNDKGIINKIKVFDFEEAVKKNFIEEK